MRNRETACNLTIIEEESCNISLKQDVIYQPVNNLMIFLSNQSILWTINVREIFIPKAAQSEPLSGSMWHLF